jgi:hypothetical protein
MTDESNEPQDAPQDESPDTVPEAGSDETAGEKAHPAKHGFREGVAKAVGYGVEVASILSQQGGDAVKAEREVAEADTEEFIDRMDGEG